jgi:hypothetical protein
VQGVPKWEDKDDTGYVITYCRHSIVWSSKQKPEITLSTTEVGYLALSTTMHKLLPMCLLMQEITKAGLIHVQLDDQASHVIT